MCACVCFGIDRAFEPAYKKLKMYTLLHTRGLYFSRSLQPKVQHISRIEREAVSAAALQRAWACKQRTLFPKCVCVFVGVRARAGACAYMRVMNRAEFAPKMGLAHGAD